MCRIFYSFWHVLTIWPSITQDNVDLLAASAQSTATIKQLRDEIVALSSNKDDLSTKLESSIKELTDLKVRPHVKSILILYTQDNLLTVRVNDYNTVSFVY